MRIKQRMTIWWAVIRERAWKWMIVTPFVILGIIQSIRDEFLSSELQEKLSVLKLLNKYLPDWPWEWWVIGLLVVSLFLILEGAYTVTQRDREKISKTKDRYDQAIANELREAYEEGKRPGNSFEDLNLWVKNTENLLKSKLPDYFPLFDNAQPNKHVWTRETMPARFDALTKIIAEYQRRKHPK